MRDPSKTSEGANAHRQHSIRKVVRRAANDRGNDMNCGTGKVRYDSRREARRGLKKARGVGGRSIREYACVVCAGWHLTSSAKWGG